MAKTLPFSKGVNFSKWFEFRSVKEIQFERYTEQDFINVKSLGADVIRVPVAVHNFTTNNNHTLDPLLLKYLDTAVDWAEKRQMFIILDNHSFHPIEPTDVNIDRILLPVWDQIARHFRDRSGYVIYEVLNEPHGIPDERWGCIQEAAVETIRRIDQKRAVIVGGTNYNSIEKLFSIPEYKDVNLIYTFHYYDPHLFTHQGATWNKPSLAPLSGLPFPADKNRIPKPHDSFTGTWVEKCLENYMNDANPDKLSAALDRAAAFAKERDVPVFCGEFGVFIIQSPPEDRVTWYKFTCDALNRLDIPWTCWDYYGGFGLFKTVSARDFNTELNVDVVRAMGFNR
ncbi:MAG: glycoside hydrolase family 5 protein [Treponema sp.]|jgi:endoglucanase|nr:glycoside hydrolase family 5 protein [Treponema sp.]